jgi:formylglycine-generating enzyme required for sulfatase activity
MKRITTVLIIAASLLLATTAFAANFTDQFTGMEFVGVKSGCFQMGDTFGDSNADEKPVHQVCVDSFFIGKYEVTQAQYQKVMGKNPSDFKKCGPNCPVETVSWEDAQEFTRQLNAKTGRNFRLPYEAEWEYAARSGGRNEQFAGTSDLDGLGGYAWFGDNSSGKTHPVGTRRPNGLGIYDMIGNVREWCMDWYDEKYYSKGQQKNPHGALSGSGRVMRGASSYDSGGRVRAAYRDSGAPSLRDSSVGFRLLLPEVK